MAFACSKVEIESRNDEVEWKFPRKLVGRKQCVVMRIFAFQENFNSLSKAFAVELVRRRKCHADCSDEFITF